MNDQLFNLDQSQMLDDIDELINHNNQMNQMTGSEHIDSTCGSEIVPKLEAQLLDKNMELDQLRSKIRQLEVENEQLRQTIQIQKENYENRLEEQERIHNREIVELKCNLDNSIFGDQQENELQIIQEENELRSLVQSQVSPNKIETNVLLRILEQVDIEDTLEWQDQESLIICKVTKLVEMIQKIELELDDWKHNYWMLEKKLNQILLQQQDKLLKQGSEEIEIEYDFDKKKIIKKSQDKQKSQQQNEDIQLLLEEIKRLKQLNSELIQQQKIMTKQMIEQLIVKQMKNDTKCLTQVSEPGVKQPMAMRNNNSQHQKQTFEHRNHYFSQYFQHQSLRIQPQQQLQQQQQQQQNDHSYDQPKTSTPTTYATPVLIKYASGSPFNQTNKILQF